MNKVILTGRLTADPEVRESQNTTVAKYRLAVDRRFKRDGEETADFIPCVVFGKGAEFAKNWLKKGTKVNVIGRIQTGSYTNKDGQKVYTTDVIVEEQEFAESKKAAQVEVGSISEFTEKLGDEFVSVPDDLSEDGLPFN